MLEYFGHGIIEEPSCNSPGVLVVFIICVVVYGINPLKAELNPICHLMALLGAHHILHVSRLI
jgi:hypothetical protein